MRESPGARFVTVFSTANLATLMVARSLLDAAAIPHHTVGGDTGNLYSLGQFFNPTRPRVQIRVPTDDAERAEELLAELED